MLRFIRDQLGITRDDLARYLGLSPNMVKSIEDGRRQIPKYCEDAVAAMVNAIKEGKAIGPAGKPTLASSDQLRLLKRRHRRFSIRLRKFTDQLEKMQAAYALACATLGTYEALVQSCTPARTEDDRLHLKWAQKKVTETRYSLQENNETAQEILTLEIASLKSMVKGLEALL
jgi:transcriptional regulator with XRE-family HTH domain